jgi:hypothetical protein
MTNKIKLEIINLCKFIFEDKEYRKVMHYLHTNSLNNLRLFIDEKCDFLEITSSFSEDEVDIKQLMYCQKLESIILGLLIEVN